MTPVKTWEIWVTTTSSVGTSKFITFVEKKDYDKLLKEYEKLKARTEKPLKDMTNKKCKSCKKGRYVETSLQDDWTGVLHCRNCGHETDRWVKQ